jgi:1,2-phenylacetyl-CoA epoxidase PaaB subunit
MSEDGVRYRRVSGDAVEYEVFARKTRVEPLHQVGSVVAPDDDLAARAR